MNILGLSAKGLSVAGLATFLAWGYQPPEAQAIVLEFGDRDCLGMGCYDPAEVTSSAELIGLAENEVSIADGRFFHTYPFTPEADDFSGTDQIYCTDKNGVDASSDGFCNSSEAIFSSLVTTLDYSAAITANSTVKNLTLGLGTSDFQTQAFGGSFIASINGQEYDILSQTLDSLENGGPSFRFFSVGIPLDLLDSSHQLTLEIDKTETSRDGIALDFLTVGVETHTPEIPTPAAIFPTLFGLVSAAVRKKPKV